MEAQTSGFLELATWTVSFLFTEKPFLKAVRWRPIEEDTQCRALALAFSHVGVHTHGYAHLHTYVYAPHTHHPPFIDYNVFVHVCG